MLTDKQRWYAEAALDLLATVILGWFVVGGIINAMLTPGEPAPGAQPPGEFEKALPLLAQILVSYGIWKLFRSFNWLKGTPPSS